jgi:hypothetical protein
MQLSRAALHINGRSADGRMTDYLLSAGRRRRDVVLRVRAAAGCTPQGLERGPTRPEGCQIQFCNASLSIW